MKTNFDKYQIFQGLSCCTEFLCDECPYQIFEHEEYKMRCIHKLIEDLAKYSKELENNGIQK